MVRQVVVDRARGDGSRSGEGQSQERLRVVERGNLGDHPADADARQVCRPVVEFAGECRGIGGKIAQGVRRRHGIDSDRRTGIAQVIPHDVTTAAREGLAERVGPREHGRAARAKNERRRRVAEVLDAERDAVRLDRRHHTNSSAMTPPEAWYEQIVGYIVASRTASWTVAPGRTAKQRIPDEFRRAERSRPSCVLRDGQPAGRKLIGPPYGERSLAQPDRSHDPCRLGIPVWDGPGNRVNGGMTHLSRDPEAPHAHASRRLVDRPFTAAAERQDHKSASDGLPGVGAALVRVLVRSDAV